VVNEGGVATLTGTISDPDLHDVFFLDVNWGDGTPTEHHDIRNGNGRRLRSRINISTTTPPARRRTSTPSTLPGTTTPAKAATPP